MKSIIVTMILFLVTVSVTNSLAQNRTLNFSGHLWSVSDGNATLNNTNLWKSDTRMQYIDSKGRLHLKIKKIFGVWYCSQVQLISAIGIGTYKITIDSGSYYDDKRLVISFAINDDLNRNNAIELSQNESEINLSISKWNDEYKGNIWYYIKPFPAPYANKQMPDISCPGIANYTCVFRAKKPVTHEIKWVDRHTVNFKSFYGSSPVNKNFVIAEKTLNTVRTPQPGNAWITVSFWLYGSNDPGKPAPGDEYEIILSSVNQLLKK